MADSSYERVLSVKNEVFVYKIPARTSNRGYRAADWTLDQPSWTGRLRIVSKDKQLSLKLEDRITGELFAVCPVDSYPGLALEQVLDSSRYFVLRIEDGAGRHAFIGIGFTDRADSFDMLVSMQDHFKWLKREEIEAQDDQAQMLDPGPKLDLGFKEGQTITINLGNVNENKKTRPRKNADGAMPGLLPPPPGGVKLPGPPRGPSAITPPSERVPTQPVLPAVSNPGNKVDLFFELDGHTTQPAQQVPPTQQNLDPWGDFTSASSSGSTATTDSDPWVQF